MYTSISKKVLLLVFLVAVESIILGQTIRTVGASGDYPTVRAAFSAINNGSVTGIITLEIISSTTGTASATLNATGTGSADYMSVLIYPVNAGLTI
jgi:hypothetical protein